MNNDYSSTQTVNRKRVCAWNEPRPIKKKTRFRCRWPRYPPLPEVVNN